MVRMMPYTIIEVVSIYDDDDGDDDNGDYICEALLNNYYLFEKLLLD